MSKTTLLEPDRTYHIFNRGVNRAKLFSERRHYFKFMNNIFKYLPVFSRIYAWCLMGNHYHIMIKTKTRQEMIDDKFSTIGEKEEIIIRRLHQRLSNMLNSYARYYNLQQNRTGPLFDSRIKKIQVTSQSQFNYLIKYIHNNPVHHYFCNSPDEYKWSSYHNYLNSSCQEKHMKEVIAEFGGKDKFIEAHLDNILKKSLDAENDI